mmetsp:Transcript_32404/g.78434  ORF Transcript_32404/g.78434 Transcript_32404/m.78434 type:complete len:101 (-) Transcript_32404:708-1010(-)
MLAKPATSNDTWRTNLGSFLARIVKISEGKAENTVSTQRRAAQLISEKATKCDLLSEFVKADKSEWLAPANFGSTSPHGRVTPPFLAGFRHQTMPKEARP